MIEKEGPGWRIVMDLSRGSFPYLLGGQSWSVEITHDEWNSLFKIVNDLKTQHKDLSKQLLPDESIVLEMERLPWWACLEGDASSWSLQVVLKSDDKTLRSFEAFWPKQVSENVFLAMRTIWDSNQ